jgi:Fe-S cluster biogenesis protein NfuA
MFIQTEITPNPSTLKFLPGRDVLKGEPAEFLNEQEAGRSPLAAKLFSIPGVTAVFFGSDFVTVTKGDGEWAHLRPPILGAIMEHFLSQVPILNDQMEVPAAAGEFFDEKDAGTVATIKELLDSRIRPAVAGDGGDITFRGFRDGTVFLAMKGSCAGCPSSTATLKHGIQNLLRHFLPDVQSVEAVS